MLLLHQNLLSNNCPFSNVDKTFVIHELLITQLKEAILPLLLCLCLLVELDYWHNLWWAFPFMPSTFSSLYWPISPVSKFLPLDHNLWICFASLLDYWTSVFLWISISAQLELLCVLWVPSYLRTTSSVLLLHLIIVSSAWEEIGLSTGAGHLQVHETEALCLQLCVILGKCGNSCRRDWFVFHTKLQSSHASPHPAPDACHSRLRENM